MGQTSPDNCEADWGTSVLSWTTSRLHKWSQRKVMEQTWCFWCFRTLEDGDQSAPGVLFLVWNQPPLASIFFSDIVSVIMSWSLLIFVVSPSPLATSPHISCGESFHALGWGQHWKSLVFKHGRKSSENMEVFYWEITGKKHRAKFSMGNVAMFD